VTETWRSEITVTRALEGQPFLRVYTRTLNRTICTCDLKQCVKTGSHCDHATVVWEEAVRKKIIRSSSGSGSESPQSLGIELENPVRLPTSLLFLNRAKLEMLRTQHEVSLVRSSSLIAIQARERNVSVLYLPL
jgi:hypothetical protein